MRDDEENHTIMLLYMKIKYVVISKKTIIKK